MGGGVMGGGCGERGCCDGGGGAAGTYRESRRSERYDRGRHMT